MVIIIRKKELEQIKKLGNWIWICGRRKTGKTFFVTKFLKYDKYFLVTRDKSIIDENGNVISFDTFFELFKELIKNKKIVIDEFHRLPEEFFDYLHAFKQGNLLAISSTLWLSQKLLGRGSPLLGLFSLYIFNIADCKDVLNSLKTRNYSELIEASTYLREPILAFNYKPRIRDYLANFLYANKLAIQEIIGEIFTEEERNLSLIYEGILKAISSGKTISTEISNYLFGKGLLKKNNPGLIQRYLDILTKIGLLEKLEVYKKKKFVYRNISPLFDLHFYLKEKYAYTENLIPLKFVKDVINEKIPFHIERFFEDLLAEHYGLKKIKIEQPEIDIALVKFKKLRLVAEVKWKKKIAKRELKNIEEKLNKFDCEKLLIVKNKKGIKLKKIKVLDAKDILKTFV